MTRSDRWRLLLSASLAVIPLVAVVEAAQAADADVQWEIDASKDPRRPVVRVSLSAEMVRTLGAPIDAAFAERCLALRNIAEDEKDGPAVFARCAVDAERRLSVTPAFKLSPGGRYRAVLSLPGRAVERFDVTIARDKPAARATVTRVSPAADVVPANLLKFYVEFSRPMRETLDLFDHLQIVDAKGTPVDDPWRRQSIWSDDGRRLTLLIHPGRIKKGVNLREELGPVLLPGKAYTLRIGVEVQDADGRSLKEPFEKRFRTSAEDNACPSLSRWKLTEPTVGRRGPLSLAFDEPLDAALAVRMIRIVDAEGNAIPGAVRLSHDDRAWNFVPDAVWPAEELTLRIDEELEDLAGNTPARVFDTDLTREASAPAVLSRRFRPVDN